MVKQTYVPQANTENHAFLIFCLYLIKQNPEQVGSTFKWLDLFSGNFKLYIELNNYI